MRLRAGTRTGLVLLLSAAAALLASAASCGDGCDDPVCEINSCDDFGAAATSCWGATVAPSWAAACQSCLDAGLRVSVGYTRCLVEHPCSSVDDTDTLERLNECIAGEFFCE